MKTVVDSIRLFVDCDIRSHIPTFNDFPKRNCFPRTSSRKTLYPPRPTAHWCPQSHRHRCRIQSSNINTNQLVLHSDIIISANCGVNVISSWKRSNAREWRPQQHIKLTPMASSSSIWGPPIHLSPQPIERVENVPVHFTIMSQHSSWSSSLEQTPANEPATSGGTFVDRSNPVPCSNYSISVCEHRIPSDFKRNVQIILEQLRDGADCSTVISEHFRVGFARLMRYERPNIWLVHFRSRVTCHTPTLNREIY